MHRGSGDDGLGDKMTKGTRKGGEAAVAGTRPAGSGRHGSATVASGRQLEAIMLESAREQLGPEADEDEVERLARDRLEGRRVRPPDPETPGRTLGTRSQLGQSAGRPSEALRMNPARAETETVLRD